MGNESSKVINRLVNEKTIVSKELLTEIMQADKSEAVQLTPKEATTLLELFCSKLQIKLKERIEISLKKLLKNTNQFTLNELIGFVQNHVPSG